jgi:hypothetical protein
MAFDAVVDFLEERASFVGIKEGKNRGHGKE